ncbi:hypothetical protein OEB99_06730 [Actinotalea sp. M2MS4P-6]|uniref:AMIN-like domain-containing (lipo)protein n=1 Tax=Actinotalea sp. M2MS4P-6 TaxID=2983762 RepID=UPI0021E4A911|nr:hypothetical protein [Actinotalea sp. M2MS4P-6]MCV2393996.1 hypothetical protein [Actinotalea sp. M2MS4P-6]
MVRARRAAVLVAVLGIGLGTASCTLDPTAGLTPSSSTAEGSTAATTSASSATGTPGTTPSTPTTGTTSGSPTPSLSPSTSPSTPVDDGGDAPPFRADTADDTGNGTGSDVGSLVDIRVSAQDGFDRVVIQLDGPDIPAWDVGYVDRALGDPSGIVVDVEGDAVLQVLLQPVAYPESGENPYDGPQKVSAAGTAVVTEAVLSSIFEGELQLFIGVDGGREPFRAYGMSDPSRIVIEVRDRLGS